MIIVETRPGDDAGPYTLFVNGTATVVNESITVCENVKRALRNNGIGCSECAEIARSIIKGGKYGKESLRM